MNGHATTPAPIALDPREGGALDWLDQVDAQGRVALELTGPVLPKGPKARERWLIERLREQHQQSFFFGPLAHTGLALDFQVLSEVAPPAENWPGRTTGTVKLTHLFLLPGEQPARELGHLREFLEWVREQQEALPDHPGITLQWYRGGHRDRGLEWAGAIADAERERLAKALEAWREQPWFERWRQANLAGLARVRMGPHCWLRLSALRAQPLPMGPTRLPPRPSGGP